MFAVGRSSSIVGYAERPSTNKNGDGVSVRAIGAVFQQTTWIVASSRVKQR